MAWDWGSAVRGGATGAATGSAAGWPGAVIGGVAGGVGGGLTGGGNKDIEHLLKQIPDQLKQYLMPYITAGQHALGQSGGAYDKLLSDPNSIISQIGAGYKESPGYKWKVEQGENAINNAAASGGMAGTAQHQQQAGELGQHLADQDYWDFVNHGVDMYKTGLSGQNDLTHLGASTGSDLATSLANLLYSRAGLKYEQGAAGNKNNSDLISSIISMLTKNSGNAFSGSSAGASGGY